MKKKYIVFYIMENVDNIKIYPCGYIYKLVGVDNEDNSKTHVYIGSTVNRLCNRKSIHKYHYKLYKNNKMSYCSSFDIYDKCNIVNIEMIEMIENITREQLREIENKYIIDNDCINKNRAHNDIDYKKEYGRIKSREFYNNHRETELNKKKKYYQDNKDKIRQKYKDNRDEILKKAKEYMKEYVKRPGVMERIQEYRERNREKANEYSKNYYLTKVKKKNI